MTSKKNENIKKWIEAYIDAIINELQPRGDVLEIGFNSEHAANLIQTYRPKSHTILENDPKKVEEAKSWGSKHAHIKVVQGKWEKDLASLGFFDQIFFNNCSQDCEMLLNAHQNIQETTEISNKMKELMNMIEEEMSQVNASFSDEEIDHFYKEYGKLYPKELPFFLVRLKEKHHISDHQYKHAMKKYDLREEVLEKKETSHKLPQFSHELLFCLETCLEKNMKKGAKFSAFLVNTLSKYAETPFFEKIISNIHVNYKERAIKIKIPDCKVEDALLMIVEKT